MKYFGIWLGNIVTKENRDGTGQIKYRAIEI